MMYQKGDIVEIVTAKYKSWNEIPDAEKGYFENQQEPAPFIGQRFRIYDFTRNGKSVYANIDGRLCLFVSIDCIRLIERPKAE